MKSQDSYAGRAECDGVQTRPAVAESENGERSHDSRMPVSRIWKMHWILLP